MPYTLRAEYAGVFMHVGDAADLAEAAAVVRIAAKSLPVECLRLTDPDGESFDPAVLLEQH